MNKGDLLKMNKSELIDAMSKEAGLTKKDTEAALKAFTKVNCI